MPRFLSGCLGGLVKRPGQLSKFWALATVLDLIWHSGGSFLFWMGVGREVFTGKETQGLGILVLPLRALRFWADEGLWPLDCSLFLFYFLRNPWSWPQGSSQMKRTTAFLSALKRGKCLFLRTWGKLEISPKSRPSASYRSSPELLVATTSSSRVGRDGAGGERGRKYCLGEKKNHLWIWSDQN